MVMPSTTFLFGVGENFHDIIDINIRTLKAHINNKFHSRLNFRRKKGRITTKKNMMEEEKLCPEPKAIVNIL
jgi:hypothetical protein